ncbi:FKBP-type peptidyl-prolyl cis-trans isomerase [Chitinophaga arvensicola]|uniref:Peptidyl-prolyl cis-trans isomerase n=1 Tax=Chitinophaga arvensicola TaxID=29529 RepID=A0A1I0SAL1_9BACT|nr:FKBP-type peptidyl-prolyl cis-trans isomerase [Chitinophaga arvensicola]SEW53609.1 FKBP-type peptidyl-prolyl cis-trans isomerase [Chitinophaga arvensicola]
MKKVFLLGGLFLLVLAACSKKDDTPPYDAIAQYDADSAKIVAYIAANNIPNVQHDPRGLWYQIITKGEGDSVKQAANVLVSYKGQLLDKSVFDSNDSIRFDLNRTIAGWILGIPKIRKGGEINLIIPSYYGYQNQASPKIPANSVLLFNVKLKDYVNK